MPARTGLLEYLRFGLLLLCAANLRGDRLQTVRYLAGSATFAESFPRTVVWAWEEPEDLSGIDPKKIGVAYLAESLRLSAAVRVRPRYQPLRLTPGTAVMAVVRIEPERGFTDTPGLRVATADALADVARRPDTQAFQVDFDATRSQRAFYTEVLERLRSQMPAGMPLSITALLSWCGGDPSDAWIGMLPVDEAVPMYFRLGVRRPLAEDKDGYRIREPLCGGSLGVSTDESWPQITGDRRLYLFAPHPWTAAQLASIARTPSTNLAQELAP
jgi:hypothetical protein